MNRWRSWSRRVTVVLLFTSGVLIVPGLFGVGAGLALVLALAVLSGLLWIIRDALATLPTVFGYDLGEYARDSWLGGVLGLLVLLGAYGVTPAEIQALGGVAGLLGMVNHFLRPLYLAVVSSVGHFLSTGQ